MDFNEKLLILNKASNDIRLGIKSISQIFKDDIDATTLIWKVNKSIDQMQKYICKKLDSDIINEEFNKIVKEK